MCAICAGGSFDIEGTIDRAGNAVIAISGDLPGEEKFAYTVGLHERLLPELIVFGQHANVASRLLNRLAEMLGSGEITATVCREIPGMLGAESEFSARFGAVDPIWAIHYGRCAHAHYERSEPGDIDFLQVIVPDLYGRFWDDPTYDPALDQVQPDLSQPEQRWRAPYLPHSLWHRPEETDVLVLVPIIESGEGTGRDEPVPARLTGPSEAEILSPPILADWVTTGTVVKVGDDATPIHPDLPWARRHLRTTRESPLFSATWTITLPDDGDVMPLAQAINDLDSIEDGALTVTPWSIHLAAPPRLSGPIRAMMRRLERDGTAKEHEPYHRSQRPGPPPRWLVQD